MKILQQLSFFNFKFAYRQILRKIYLLIEILMNLILHELLFTDEKLSKPNTLAQYIHALQRTLCVKVS
jgi:hypothetical protein